jgi:TPR repeat protein
MRAAPEPVALAVSRTVFAGSIAERVKAPTGSLWVRRLPKDAARHARLTELTRRYGRHGASPQFIDRLAAGDVVGALNALKAQAIAGDPSAIDAYGSFTYWNCFLHRSTEQLDSYSAMQMQESRSLPAADGEWFREAFMDDIAFERAVVDACNEVVVVDQAFDLVYERAKQGDGGNLWLASLTAGNLAESQQLLRAAASAGSADAQFEIAVVVLGGHQQELLGTGADALDIGDLLRQSAERIPQAEGNLATCEFYGCPGVVADPAEAVRTALSAAEHGFPDALLDIGPHLTPSQLDPADVEAWKLIQASVGLRCGASWSDVKAMKATLDTLSSPAASVAARQRAEQLWAQFGAQLGC